MRCLGTHFKNVVTNKRMPEKIKFDFKKLSNIYDLLHKKHECAGTLIVKNKEMEGYTISKGDVDSVHTPLSTWNWHTHPLFLYEREEVCWGWPSGEDLREVVFFGLAGNRAHFVFAVEGVYVLNTTRCFKKWLKKIITNPWDRGIIISFLELIFKSTHNLRTNSYNTKYPLHPEDWVMMVERLRIRFFFDKKPVKKDPCGKVTCRKITTHDGGNRDRELMPLEKYTEQYEGDVLKIYKVGRNGSINGSRNISIKYGLKRLEELEKSFSDECPDARIYNVRYYSNGRGKSRFDTLKPSDKKKLYGKIDKIRPPADVKVIDFA